MLTPDGGHLAALADWTDRIKAGELPSATPPRPTGIERNVVVTVRDWSDPKHYLHDLTLTDKRKPTVNGYGLIYGAAELSTDNLPILDPVNNTKTTMKVPVRDPKYTPSSALANPVLAPSPYWGSEQIWDTQVNAHNPMMDQDGRVYFTAQPRSPKDPPDYCKRNSPLRSAQLYPLAGTPDGFVQNARQITVYDPKTKKFSFIDTCFGTHHLNFAEDANNTLWLSNNSQGNLAVVGWINTKMYWETGDQAKSQGWTPLIVDTNGNGKRDEGYNEPGRPRGPQQGHPHRVRHVRHFLVAARRLGLGLEPGSSGLHHPPRSRDRIRRRPRWRKSTRFRCRATASAAWTSTATASSGRRSTAATSRASTAASARGRSTVRAPNSATNVRKAGASIRFPGPGFQGDAGAAENPVLHLGRPARHSRPRRQHADRHRQPVRLRCTRWSADR